MSAATSSGSRRRKRYRHRLSRSLSSKSPSRSPTPCRLCPPRQLLTTGPRCDSLDMGVWVRGDRADTVTGLAPYPGCCCALKFPFEASHKDRSSLFSRGMLEPDLVGLLAPILPLPEGILD